MTEGVTLYLVSASGSAEEFVAAFRRYADRTGLFIPLAAPLPVGRRGRLALTLKDGGVMIEGEAEILQSSAKPTVLYGRPGMTIKFIAPDEPSKIVIAELEKARLAMKPAPPSVPPRPADIPAEPRPVVPAVGGRIDAANALAECVVIGDLALLRDPATSPRSVADSPSGRKFIVPLIPGAPGERPRTPSTPPEPARPRTPSTPPELGARPRTPTTPPDPASKPVPVPTNVPASKPMMSHAHSSKLTSIGFPALDKLPASPTTDVPAAPTVAPAPAAKPKAMVDPGNPLLKTVPGTTAPANATRQMSAAIASLTDEDATTIGSAPDAPPPRVTTAADHESTDIGAPPPVPASTAPAEAGSGPIPTAAGRSSSGPVPTATSASKSGPVRSGAGAESGRVHASAPAPSSGPVPTASTGSKSGAVRRADEEPTASGLIAPPPPPAPAPAPLRAPAAPLPSLASSSKQQHKATSIGFPVVRTPFETQQVGVVPQPAAPIVPSDGRRPAQPPAARGKSPTKPPLFPRQPTPVAPVPIVRSPARSTPVVEDEMTEISAEAPGAPGAKNPETVVAGAAYVDAAKAADSAATSRSGGMRASEILAAIPTADWTMAPDASKPTVMPYAGWTPAAGHPTLPSPEGQEPTPAPGTAPKGPPTGDWTIQLDPEAPEAGWSAPSKLAPQAPQAPRAKLRTPSSGNPDIAVASAKPIQAVEWEEKPTGIGEAKIEIDPTLMEPLKPMPTEDDDAAEALSAPPAPGFEISGPSPFAAPPISGRAGTEPLAGVAALGAMLRAPSAPQPLVGSRPLSGSTPIVGPDAAPLPGGPVTGGFSASAQFPQAMPLPTTPAPQLFTGYAPAQNPGGGRKRTMIIIAACVAAVVAGFALVLLLSGGKSKPSAGNGPTKQGSSVPPKHVTGSGDDDGSATMAVGSDGAGSGGTGSGVGNAMGSAAVMVEPPPTNTGSGSAGTCTVAVASVPTGADIFVGKTKRGTTPGDIELPCGKAATVVVRKAKFDNTDRDITPSADKPNKLVIKLGKPSVTLKVTSTPAGATITVGGKSMGVTPARIKLPAFEPASIVLSKSGFTSDTTRLTPKRDNATHHVTLKKGGGRR